MIVVMKKRKKEEDEWCMVSKKPNVHVQIVYRVKIENKF